MGEISEKFKKRKEFDEANPNFAYPDLPSLYTKYYIDTWNVSPLYGKVDTKGIPVIPRYNLTRYCSYGTDKTQVSALQPVLEFFFPLRSEYQKHYSLGSINKGSKYFKDDLPPVRGLIDSNIEYFDIIKRIFFNFTDYLNDYNKLSFIQTYDDFLNELLIYVKNKNTYLTRAGYVESYDFSMLHTGLAIDIYDGDGSDDNERLDFFNDVNQFAFLETCISANMKIDREIPWRVIADIRTKENKSIKTEKLNLDFASTIKQFIPAFTDNLQLFFDTFYYKVVPYDSNSFYYFTEFVSVLQSFYISFIEANPTYKKYFVNECGKANVVVVQRKQIDENILTYDREKYVNLYLKFRSAELSKVVPEEELLGYLQLSMNIYKNQKKDILENLQNAIILSIKTFSDNIGTLAYRNPSLYELDAESKMP